MSISAVGCMADTATDAIWWAQKSRCVAQVRHAPVHASEGEAAGHFRSAQWSADGTSVVTNSEDGVVRCHVMCATLFHT